MTVAMRIPGVTIAQARCLGSRSRAAMVGGPLTGRARVARHFSTSQAARDEIELTVDGRPVKIERGSALIQACEKAGVRIPRFCYHDRLAIAGNCRMCLVEVERSPKPVASCAAPAMPGSKVYTDSPLVRKAREGVMEFLLANHPLDCPICDQGGECDLQDQSMAFGSDRGRFHEFTGKRAVEDKDMGPLVKTVMTRCIQCTRCVRFANEVAGVDDLGTTGRGNDLQIGMYIEKTLNSEISGNVIDLCPVGALTSKPYAFRARPWELHHTNSIDVTDAVGSNIRIDHKGVEVMRVQPRLNDDVNEEWISDKTRFSNDGLKYQRLTTPLMKQGDRFMPVTWEEALQTINNAIFESGAQGNEIKAIAGDLADAESLLALRDLMHRLGSENLALDHPKGSNSPVHGIDIRANYIFNSSIPGVEEADYILLVGTNPRHEAAVLNSRIRKSWVKGRTDVGLIGEAVDPAYGYEHLGTDAKALLDLTSGKSKSDFAKGFAKAKRPMIIVGSAVADHADGGAIYAALGKYVDSIKDRIFSDEWRGYNILQRAASRVAAYDLGWGASSEAAKTPAKFVYLLGADEVTDADIPQDAFVVYQGHHGDVGAQYANVCLPATAYTEKGTTYVNTEGRAQLGRAAVPSPGAAREDWKIIRALSEILNVKLPYDDVLQIRQRMYDVAPHLLKINVIETPSRAIALTGFKTQAKLNEAAKVSGKPLEKPIKDFYLTDSISRSSVTMAKCSNAFTYGMNQGGMEYEGPIASHGSGPAYLKDNDLSGGKERVIDASP